MCPQADHEARCAQLRTTYEEDLAAARAHNEAIWPQVLRARIAQAELGRVRVRRDTHTLTHTRTHTHTHTWLMQHTP